ncbi:cyclic nucleotide-binding domain-containing protein [Deltaproteobacteria bacterium TL4]
MITFSIICQKPEIVEKVRHSLTKAFKDEIEFTVLSEPVAIDFHLYYEMPQYILMDLDDAEIHAVEIIPKIVDDPWLSSTGVLGISEHVEEYMSTVRGVFSIIQPNQIATLLPGLVRILSSNDQLLLPGHMLHDLGHNGSILIENKPELLEAYSELIATNLYNHNLIDIQTKFGLKFSLVEMLMNGVEHGNCAISYAEKQAWLEKGRSILQLIEKKCKDPAIAAKKIKFTYNIGETRSTFTIEDEGEGFDTSKLPAPKETNLMDLHGRGVYMTRHYVNDLFYNKKGNKVTIVVNHLANIENIVPEGFITSQKIHFNPGDIVFKKNDKADTLYYIISGEFEIIIDGHVVNTLNSTSVFLGEMAFLLGNRRTATVRAKNESSLVAIRVREWVNAVQRYPYYGIFLARLIARKLNEQTRSIVANSSKFMME